MTLSSQSSHHENRQAHSRLFAKTQKKPSISAGEVRDRSRGESPLGLDVTRWSPSPLGLDVMWWSPSHTAESIPVSRQPVTSPTPNSWEQNQKQKSEFENGISWLWQRMQLAPNTSGPQIVLSPCPEHRWSDLRATALTLFIPFLTHSPEALFLLPVLQILLWTARAYPPNPWKADCHDLCKAPLRRALKSTDAAMMIRGFRSKELGWPVCSFSPPKVWSEGPTAPVTCGACQKCRITGSRLDPLLWDLHCYKVPGGSHP